MGAEWRGGVPASWHFLPSWLFPHQAGTCSPHPAPSPWPGPQGCTHNPSLPTDNPLRLAPPPTHTPTPPTLPTTQTPNQQPTTTPPWPPGGRCQDSRSSYSLSPPPRHTHPPQTLPPLPPDSAHSLTLLCPQVDAARTPQQLERLLDYVHETGTRRTLLVVGCPGETSRRVALRCAGSLHCTALHCSAPHVHCAPQQGRWRYI